MFPGDHCFSSARSRGPAPPLRPLRVDEIGALGLEIAAEAEQLPSHAREGYIIRSCRGEPLLLDLVRRRLDRGRESAGSHPPSRATGLDSLASRVLNVEAAASPLAPIEAALLIARAARRLADLHARGVVHGAINPENLLLDGAGGVRLRDRGLVVQAERSREGSAIAGQDAYLSPELARGEPMTAPGDVYSLGATLHFALAGEEPYSSPAEPAREVDPRAELLRRIACPLHGPRPLPARVPATLRRICALAMEIDPLSRYASAAELARDLEAFAAGRVPPVAGPDSTLQPVALFMRRHAAAVALATVLAATFMGGVVAYVRSIELARRAAEDRAFALAQMVDAPDETDPHERGAAVLEAAPRRAPARLNGQLDGSPMLEAEAR